eukprot:CAMPEP_0198124006 /NCGR_PEP_ID=MMETSP1442-20131203/38890_1 /TAXON_ID= /ORGANISM="Craspedostauros australis, Strain CCMP3328" /LENGTH=59 /DNA_ID=CAMNT_0043783315 /DNA_START=21 /DNA_END=197 /DNA_ORIENTATION=-
MSARGAAVLFLPVATIAVHDDGDVLGDLGGVDAAFASHAVVAAEVGSDVVFSLNKQRIN